ncbi:hypothetical protein B0H15DRAFT_830392 [Mycena belliarum]|uniref:Uncharacterized protein n=1 Tax=Mycena belliarum TaxID=1033014 RepID=A0AAD6XTL0_9AGAR|nr:hypothetical protein B0H15DRAFT_830392 [Mycena belliae]
MPFRTRNPYYLRISEKNVLPLYLYLDGRHVNWMTDSILQHVLADLQPKILPKLKAEADAHSGTSSNNKKATVDTHRGDSYQFCYFIRKTEPHSVLIKTRHFSAAPLQRKPDMPHPLRPQGSKRKGRKLDSPRSSTKRRKTKGKGKAREGDESDEAISSPDEEAEEHAQEGVNVRRSQRNKKFMAGGYRENDGAPPGSDIEMEDEPQNGLESVQVKPEASEPRLSQVPGESLAAPIDIDIEIDEEKPKPVLKLTYQDFSIYGHCLCIVVEPYPPIRSASRVPSVSRAPSVAFFAPRGASAAPPSSALSTASLRARTPLFLPDEDERGETPAPRQGTLPPVPLFDEDDEDQESDNGGMIAFSQAMNNYDHLPAGAADDDDDMDGADGAVFFGDADEVKEL